MKEILASLMVLVALSSFANSDYSTIETEFNELPSSQISKKDVRDRIETLYAENDMSLTEHAIIAKGPRSCDKKTAKYTTSCTDSYFVKDLDSICKLKLSEMTVLKVAPERFYDRAKREVSISTVNQSGTIVECRKQ